MSTAELKPWGGPEQAYRPLFELGRGGMARVYLAESQAFGIRKLVVLKVLNHDLCGDPTTLASFRREAELAAQMNHPNVVQVIAVDEFLGAPTIVMEYLDGSSLSAVMKQAGKHMPLRLRMYVLSQVLEGLHYFHELRDLEGTPLNPVHRDVSPQNVMILNDGPVKVLDFGIAKINAPDSQTTRTGVIRGKIHYMSPEQLLAAAHVDRRADIFAVGVMLWEAAANRRMWEGQSEIHTVRSLATGSLPNLRDAAPGVPWSVLEIVKCATNLERDHRFTTAQEMQSAIDRAMAQEGWLVQSHELADFMSQQFGESRRERERQITRMLRTLRGSNSKREPTSGTHLVSSRGDNDSTANSAARMSHLPVSRSLLPGKARWGWLAAGGGCLALLVAWVVWRQTRPLEDVAAPTISEEPVTAATTSETPMTVALEVEASPRGAEILLDGKVLGRDRYTGQQPQNDNPVVLEVRAPGYLSATKEITLGKDMSLQFALQPDPALAGSAEPSSPPPERPRSVETTPRPRAAPPRTTLAAPKREATPAKPSSRHCSPPYTLGADGVKTYKRECFQ